MCMRTAKRRITDAETLKEIRKELSSFFFKNTRSRPTIVPLVVEA